MRFVCLFGKDTILFRCRTYLFGSAASQDGFARRNYLASEKKDDGQFHRQSTAYTGTVVPVRRDSRWCLQLHLFFLLQRFLMSWFNILEF